MLTLIKKFLIILIIEFIFCYGAMADTCNEILDHLNDIKSITTEFSEMIYYNDNTILQHGNILVQKPGKMRIDYNEPRKISIFLKNDMITYYDHELDEVTKLKQHQRFLSFLSKTNIDLNKEFNNHECNIKGNKQILTLYYKEDEDDIKLQLIFLKYNLNIVNIYINNIQKSTIKLYNTITNAKIDNDKLTFKDKQFFNIYND